MAADPQVLAELHAIRDALEGVPRGGMLARLAAQDAADRVARILAAQEAQEGPADRPEAPTPQADHTAPLTAALAALTPSRAYAAPDTFNWARDRQAHHHHHAAHLLGALAAHAAVLGSRALGRTLGHHARRTIAHALHGAAHHLHPHGEPA